MQKLKIQKKGMSEAVLVPDTKLINFQGHPVQKVVCASISKGEHDVWEWSKSSETFTNVSLRWKVICDDIVDYTTEVISKRAGYLNGYGNAYLLKDLRLKPYVVKTNGSEEEFYEVVSDQINVEFSPSNKHLVLSCTYAYFFGGGDFAGIKDGPMTMIWSDVDNSYHLNYDEWPWPDTPIFFGNKVGENTYEITNDDSSFEDGGRYYYREFSIEDSMLFNTLKLDYWGDVYKGFVFFRPSAPVNFDNDVWAIGGEYDDTTTEYSPVVYDRPVDDLSAFQMQQLIGTLPIDMSVTVTAKYTYDGSGAVVTYWLKYDGSYYPIIDKNVFISRSSGTYTKGEIYSLIQGTAFVSTTQQALSTQYNGVVGLRSTTSITSSRYNTPHDKVSTSKYTMFLKQDSSHTLTDITNFTARADTAYTKCTTLAEVKTALASSSYRYELGTFTISPAQFKSITGVNP